MGFYCTTMESLQSIERPVSEVETLFYGKQILRLFDDSIGSANLDFDAIFTKTLLSRTSVKAVSSPAGKASSARASMGKPTPAESWKAWLQCAAAFCTFFSTWGLLNTYGKTTFQLQCKTARISVDCDKVLFRPITRSRSSSPPQHRRYPGSVHCKPASSCWARYTLALYTTGAFSVL